MPAQTTAKPLRADAQRNRDAILTAALQAFESEGVYASLDGIAVKAGVGNATLYRNFPTRDDLLAAVIDESIVAQMAEGERLAATLAPAEALREWLQQLVWRIRVWHDLPACVVTAMADDASPMNDVTAPLVRQTDELLSVARAEGAVVAEVTADEAFELVTALSWAVDRFGDDADRARRRVALATAGLFA